MKEGTNTVPEGGTVLLVEDDAGTRGMIARHLRGCGFTVTPMESAEQVILEGGSRAFDVVISDVHLPGTSGIDLASHLLKRNPAQPVVLITGDPDEALAREALSRGPVSYLLKPFELFELDAAVRRAVLPQRPVAAAVVAPEEPVDRAGVEKIPAEWLAFVDERSYAGPGHGDRVARITLVLAGCAPSFVLDATASELAVAARMHEIGRLGGPTSNPAELAVRGGIMLEDAGFPAAVVRAVRHLHERWDGTGGPDGLSASQIPAPALVLAAADSLDHYCAAWQQAGLKAADAADRAVGLVMVQQGTVFSPLVAAALHREREAVRGALVSDRGGVRRNSASESSGAAGESDRVLRLA